MTSFNLLVYFPLEANLLEVISEHWRGRVTKLGWQPAQAMEQQSPGSSDQQDSRHDECRGQRRLQRKLVPGRWGECGCQVVPVP